VAFDPNGALDLLRRGDAKAARAAAEATLKLDSQTPGAQQVLGLAALQMGDAAAAAPALRHALDSNPGQAGLWEIFGGALEALNDHQGSLAEAVRLAPSTASQHRLRGMTLQRLGRMEEAEQALRKAIDFESGDPEAWFWLGNALYGLMRHKEAVTAFEAAIQLNPRWVDALLNLAVVLAELGLREAAIETYQTALELSPDNPTILRHVAITLHELQHTAEAERLFRQALDLDPSDAETAAALANMYEQTNRLDDAAEMVERALAIDSNNVQAQRLQVVLARRRGDTSGALENIVRLLEQQATRSERGSLMFERARLHDKRGEADEAIRAFSEANTLQAQSPAGLKSNPVSYREQVNRELDIWQTTPPDQEDPSAWHGAPIFLMGFPRSGTTLLDQILNAHPDLTVLDERPPLAEVHDRLSALEMQAGHPYVRLDAEQRQAARQYYFTRVKSFLPHYDGGLLVDKHPLATTKIRVIKLLFPDAKIIFALRHPCDVVLSCFMQQFVVNAAMANFTTLEDTAALYGLVMNVWRAAEPKLNLPVHRIRYEDVVQDFETQIKALVSFVGVPWRDDLIDFHEHAQLRHVRTASYAQVTQPLYTSAVERWQKYSDYLSPHIVTLQPYLDEFGYTANIKKGK
jgi:tetratricopeptide (TPR) repeat protein